MSFLIAELIGVVTIGILADHYGRKLMLLMCLYIPVVSSFVTTRQRSFSCRCRID
jgi:MFS family permease